ncbi:glycoside hydrolase family 43 protein, partial [Neolentinus lepideus HHB14362 ss-1]
MSAILRTVFSAAVVLTASFVLGALCPVSAVSFPDPLALQGAHVYVHDPSLIQRQSDGKYFLFTSHNKSGIITADQLQGPWTEVGSTLPNNSSIQLPGRSDIWAPDVSYHNGTYYQYYAVSTSGSHISGIGLATSASMDPGTWTDHGLVIQSNNNSLYNCIDPTLLVDTNGTRRLTFGSYWNDTYQVNLGADYQTVISQPVHTSFNASGNHDQEGSFLWPHGGYYYFFVSSGQCCGFDPQNLPPPGTEYKVFVGRSPSPSGPFIDQAGVDMLHGGGTLVIASHGSVYAPGGEGVFTDSKSGKDIFVYHYLPADGPAPYTEPQASLGLNAIDWSSGWPVLTSI